MPDPTVLVVGDANLDLVLTGDVVPRFGQAEQLVDQAALTLGGSASLVAHGLARLGVTPLLVAAVGDDSFAAHTKSLLAAAGVDLTCLRVRPDAASGFSVILSATDRAILTYLGTISSLTAADLPPWTGIGHAHFSSVYLVPHLRPKLPELVRQARELGITTSVDTNDDPRRQWEFLVEILDTVEVVLPNEGELLRWAAALDEPTEDWLRAARSVAARGPLVVVKRGAAGGALVHPTGDVETRVSPTVTPIDTTGAGDSFVAGWIAATASGCQPYEALGWAVTAGSLSTLALGGASAQPNRAELLSGLEKL